MALFGSGFSASFSLEEFVGHGALQSALPALLHDGWDDVPTLKLMSSQDMEAHKLTPQQRDALEIRAYLHDRSLMQYADKLEASGQSLLDLLATSPGVLSSRYGMKRGHVARFIDRGSTSCGLSEQKLLAAHRIAAAGSRHNNLSPKKPEIARSGQAEGLVTIVTDTPTADYDELVVGEACRVSVDEIDADRSNPHPASASASSESFKGIVSAGPAAPRLCGLVRPARVAEDIIPISTLEKVSVQKLAPEYRLGVDPWGKSRSKKGVVCAPPPPMKASDIWASKPTVLYCIRRPGCVMCRAEAHQLYSRKPIFDALGVQLVAVLHEHIDSEVRSFWPRFWGGMIFVDKSCGIFRALGGGRLPTDNYLTGLLFNAAGRENRRRARKSGIHNNLHGNGLIKGGLLVIRAGKGGVAYQFAERNIGDWAPLEEVLDVCGRLHALASDAQKVSNHRH